MCVFITLLMKCFWFDFPETYRIWFFSFQGVWQKREIGFFEIVSLKLLKCWIISIQSNWVFSDWFKIFIWQKRSLSFWRLTFWKSCLSCWCEKVVPFVEVRKQNKFFHFSYFVNGHKLLVSLKNFLCGNSTVIEFWDILVFKICLHDGNLHDYVKSLF